MNVNSSTGEQFSLDQVFSRGGEAEIWSIRQEPHLVAKRYHKPMPEHEAKIMAMLANPPQQPGTHPAVAWPLQLLYENRRFTGYLMPRIHDSRPIFHFYNPARRARMGDRYPWRVFLHRSARNLATAVELVHKRGYVIGDLNESNVLVNRSALVTLVDADSFQVGNGQGTLYRCPVGKAEFTPTELQGVDFKSVDRTVAHDNFGLAVLIFYLLMEGYHPFAGVKEDGISVGRVDLHGIRHGLFPYTRNSIMQPPPGAPIFMWLDPSLQALFHRAFVEGHTAPDRRPAADEWHEALSAAEAGLATCSATPHHIFSGHLRRCPHCNRSAIPAIAEPQPIETDGVNGNVPTAIIEPATWLQLLVAARRQGWPAVKRAAQQKAHQNFQSGLQQSRVWTKEQGVALWQGGQQQVKSTLLALHTFPERMQTIRETTQTYGTVWQRWLVGNAVGSPAGALAAVGCYQLVAQGATVPAIAPFVAPLLAAPTTSPQLLSVQLLWAICGLCFGLMIGLSQAWALRTVLLRWRYLRELWVATSGLAGLLLGALAYHQLPFALPIAPIWSLAHVRLSALVLLFGAMLGIFQSFILRQQLPRADDSRVWTVTSALSWLLVFEGTLLGLDWDLGQWPATSWAVVGKVDAQLWHWFAVWLGCSLGLLLAGVTTGTVLLWLLQGPRRAMLWRQLASQLLHWRSLPQQIRQATFRWSRGLLLLGLLVLLIEGLLQLSR